MTKKQEVLNYIKNRKTGVTLLDLQRHRIGGTAADRRMRELRAEGKIIDLYTKKVGKTRVKVWAAVRAA